jgi:RNA polymerase sporulation-specific sigma factor
MKRYESMGEEELARLAAGNDAEALERLYAAYRDVLRSKANLYFMVGADRDDVIQEGMIGLFFAIRNYDTAAGASFRTFAELCIKRQIINAVKMAGRKKHTPLNESVPIDAGEKGEGGAIEETLSAAGFANPEEIVLLADLLDYIGSNAPKLFSGMELLVWKSFVDGKGAAEIAGAFGKSPKSIDNALQRIKKKVEKLVALY